MKFKIKLKEPVLKYRKVIKLLIWPFILLVTIYGIASFSELVNVAFLDAKGYPWGCKCFEGMEHYASPEIYSLTMLLHVLMATALLIVMWWILQKINSIKREGAVK